MTSQTVEQQLECPICLDRFETPKVLPCQHSFCADCLVPITRNGSVKCPECQRVHPVPADGFPCSIAIQRFLSAFQPPNVPTVNEPTIGPGLNTPFRLGVQSLDPPPARLPPVYHPSQPQQLIPVQPAQYNQPSQSPGNAHSVAVIGWLQPPYPPPPPLPRVDVHGYRDPQPHSTSFQAPREIPSENASEDDSNFQKCKTVSLKYYKLTKQGIGKVTGKLINKYETFMGITMLIFLIITVTRLIAGSVMLKSDCSDEKRVAEYLFAKSIIGFIFWFILLLFKWRKQLANAIDNNFFIVTIVIVSLFQLIWLIIGTVWIFGSRKEMIEECPFYVGDWNKHFINFASFLTVVDWIGLAAFGFYFCYVQFEKPEESTYQH